MFSPCSSFSSIYSYLVYLVFLSSFVYYALRIFLSVVTWGNSIFFGVISYSLRIVVLSGTWLVISLSYVSFMIILMIARYCH
ncbi:hypothetical protein BDZ91DRAFT_722800 [Kalaharituber pfeilii]|nr:hypothetical protein BDZ91DRAFT_722800 [Kalaharituber pfeilii]